MTTWKLDTHFGKKLAQRSTERDLTDGEVFFGKKLCNKYRRQLRAYAPAVLEDLGIK